MKLAKQIIIIILVMIFSGKTEAQIQFGLFADCQFCDYETAGTRFYRNSLTKLNDCISEFNKNKNLEFVVGLGDLVDRDFASFSKVNSILNKSENEVFHVVGNHDFSVDEIVFDKVPEQLNLSKTYHSFSKKGWQFIFLNGNEITFQSTDPEIIKQAEIMIKKLSSENKPNQQKWNGGISEIQINWLEKQLQNSEKESLKVVIFCHFPLLPLETHTLWNSEKVLAVLEKYDCVKLWMNGHNHAGNYASLNGIHFVTMKGMVDTKNENAFSVVSFSENKIKIKGFGREENRTLSIK